MQSKMLNAVLKTAVFASVLLIASVSSAAEVHHVYLKAQSFEKLLPDGEGGTIPVRMWGFASCADDTFGSIDPLTCDANDAPGLQINAAAGDTLNIHLNNNLPLTAGNISIMIPGQVGGGDPEWIYDDQSQRRVKSLTKETAPTTTEIYTWNDLRPGTYLYQSGTHQSIQVPMGLYGALIVRPDTLGSSYAQTVIDDGASHYYRLGESLNTDPALDEAGTTNGTYGSTVMPGSLGYSTDKAAGFNGTGTDFVDTNVTMLSDTAFSVEAWVNATTIGTAGHRIVAKDKIGTPGQFILWFNEGALRFQVRNSDDVDAADWVIAEAPATPLAGTTFHVVGVFDGTDVILYVDGAEVDSQALTTIASKTNALPITIGTSSLDLSTIPPTPRNHIFDGTIDEVAIYESALTATQIQEHFLANSFEPVLLFSEIDPIQNQRVDDEAMLAPPTAACVSLAEYSEMMTPGYPCTIDYNPFILLVNGEPTPDLSAGAPGNSVLLRLLNAGLRSHTPAIVGLEMGLVAEDGNAYPGLPRRQSKALLPAGKTLDAILGVDDGAGNLVMPGGDATFGLFDREPTFSNEALPNGGGLVNLQVGTGSPTPMDPTIYAVNDIYAVDEDSDVINAPTVLGNDVGLMPPTLGVTATVVSPPSNAESFTLYANGTFDYTPNPNFSGGDGFTYSAELSGITYSAQVTLNVTFENDAPTAVADGPYVNTLTETLTVDAANGVLGNDSDPDGDSLTAKIVEPAPAGLTLDPDGSFTYDGGAATTFMYTATDGMESSDPVMVTLDFFSQSKIKLTVEEPGGGTGIVAADYRWTVEEDVMWQPDPPLVQADTLATNFHKSYMPIVAQGTGPAEFLTLALDPAKHYYVSVLPSDAYTGGGHTIGGARISPADQAAHAVTVNVNPQPLPSAQISIFVFEDSSPTNGSVDGNERSKGLGGFQITLEDAGGRYGISAGQMSQDANGNPLKNALDCFGGAGATPPAGIILTCPVLDPRFPGVVSPLAGQVLIQNLFPGKYGIITSPPAGDTETWTQTSTIEGTKVIDAWVKAGEPAFFQEFGPAGWHVFVGFVNPANLILPPGGGNTVTGTVTNIHMSRPPSIGVEQLWDSGSNVALSHTRSWVGLNSTGGLGDNIAAVQADADGNFTILNVPDGNYQLVVWDSYLDQLIAFTAVTLPGTTGGALGNVPVFQWFARSEHNVFLDENQNGILDDGEKPIAEQAVNLRWRDGTVNQSFPTDLDGFVPFDQTFPFFHWQVLEVDFARFKATGLTVTVDAGGNVDPLEGYEGPHPGLLNPQIQVEDCTTPACLSRTETGPVLTSGFQGFLGTTSIFDWGKAPYAEGENGGISGIVYYPSTRAENDPRLAAVEPWEPGIAGVKVRLYRQVETLADAPSHYYRLGELLNTDPAADETGASNGTYGSTVVLQAPGLVGDSPNTAAGFDGTTATDFVDTGVTSMAADFFSVEAWVNANTIGTAGHRIVAKDKVGTPGQFILWFNQGDLRFQVRNAGNTAWVIAEAPTTPAAGTTFHVVGVFDGADAVLFVDGVEVARTALGSATTNTNTLPITIGADSDPIGSRGHIFNGTIDEVAIYESALTATQIQAHFDANGALTTALALLQETTTDDWDNSLPTGCPGADPSDEDILGAGNLDKCYDGLRNFNQARPAVFDGGYAFMGQVDEFGEPLLDIYDNQIPLPPGKYVVEVVTPPGYDLLKEEDNNVGYGDSYDMAPVPILMAAAALAIPDPAMVLEAMSPEPGLAQPPCVGAEREVPAFLSLFPAAEHEAPFAGAMRPLCDRKEVILSDQGQAAADFFLFTGTPIAGHFAGMILDDIAVEFSTSSPQFSEKWAPPFVPVSVRDYNGNEISRFYSDQWGRMNGLVPSTFTANLPSPSGFSPAMHTACMNDPGPILVDDVLREDPQYNAAYSNFCYTFQYMPGTTTYLDTPVLPVSAFAAGYNPPDCALDAGTPMIFQVDGTGVGPLVEDTGTDILTITSLGMTAVPNPAYEGPPAEDKTIMRDFGFGTCAEVDFSDCSVTVGVTALEITSWDDGTIEATVPIGTLTGQLIVTRNNGKSTDSSITVTVGTETSENVIRVAATDSIQAAIEAAIPGALILVAPGTYEELVIMSKPVRLQGAGAGSTFINAVKRPAEKIEKWRSDMERLFLAGNTLPNQTAGPAGMETEEGAAITVFGTKAGSFTGTDSRIDGFSITGGDIGGGIFVNGWAHGLEIANNKVFGNSGLYAGGIRVGRPFLQVPPPADKKNGDPGFYAFNEHVNIHNNAITQNGGLGGAGGGLSLATGSDKYAVSNNFVCGNFTTGDGGGIGHFGRSDKGVIANNKIMFNQSFNQAVTVSGGGLFIGGERVVPEFIELDNPNGLGIGSGSVTVDANLIQGNQAASGHGGGIRTQFVNGSEVTDESSLGKWFKVTLTNNMIVNNVAGWSGAGISMQDTAQSFVINNTVAHNDSTATVSAAFPTGIANPSANQPAGISTEPHSAALTAAIPNTRNTAGVRDFSNPVLENNIVWQNRSFHYDGVLMPALSQTSVGQCASGANYWDLGVLGGAFTLDPRFSVLTDALGFDASNTSDDPALVMPYCNGGRTLESTPGPMTAYAAVDEGGANWIDVRFGPLTPTWPAPTPGVSGVPWDYHINVVTSSARGNGIVNGNTPITDFDGEDRPQTSVVSDPPYLLVDRGADEVLDDVVFIPGDLPGTVAFTSGAFGDVLLNVAKPITITAVVSGADVDFGAQDATDLTPFEITGDTCSTMTVVAGADCEFTVTYTPTIAGPDSASFSVASTASGSPQTVNLTGTGIANIITFDPDPGLFGVVPVGTTKTLTFTATVLGDPVDFNEAVVTGDDYSINSQTCSLAVCSVEVSYSPTAVAESNGALTISSNGTGNPHIVLLEAGGVAPATVTYSSGDFGEVLAGTTATLTIDALVSGTTVTFDDPATGGPAAGSFAILSETCSGSTVTDGATCSFTVTYSPLPTADGADSASFTVTSNALVGTQTVNLAGTAVPPGTVAFTSATRGDPTTGTLAFGNGGQLSSTVTLTVSVSPVTFDTVTVVNTLGGNRFDEAGGGTCEDATIAVDGTCTVVIDFNGGGNDDRAATLTVLHDGSNSPSTLSLTGN